MQDKLFMIGIFTAGISIIYSMTMFATPGRGAMKLLERTAAGGFLCYLCYVLLYPLGIRITQTPFAALCAGYLGLPGVAFATFVSLWQ